MSWRSRVVRSVRRRGVLETLRMALAAGIASVTSFRVRGIAELPFHILRNPRHALEWFRDRTSPLSPLQRGLPWLSWPCVDFLSAFLTPGDRVFEFGGGGSTVFFLQQGCRVTTVESSEEWATALRTAVAEIGLGDSWDLRFVPVANNDDPRIRDYTSEVISGGPWRVVLVDGWDRLECVTLARDHVLPGGIIVFDNGKQPQFRIVPRLLPGWPRDRFSGLGVSRWRATCTDVYWRPLAGGGSY